MGIPRLTNNQLRPTSIRLMKRGKKDDRFIMSITEHKRMATIANYDPEPEMDERFDAARLQMGGRKKQKILVETVTKTLSRTSITHHEPEQNFHKKNDRETSGRETIVRQTAGKGLYIFYC